MANDSDVFVESVAVCMATSSSFLNSQTLKIFSDMRVFLFLETIAKLHPQGRGICPRRSEDHGALNK